jgi:ribonuclease P protein component
VRSNHEENLPAKQKKKEKDSWLPGQNEDPGRPESHQEQTDERQKKNCCLMRESLPPQERIRKKKDFLIIYKKGSRYKSKYFNLIYLSNTLAYSRVGVVASKKIGNAVTRNKVKRWIRELFRRNKNLLEFPMDLLIVATSEMREASWAELKEDYLFAVKKIFEKRKGR